jgi:putative FmdB family regulatory protein
MADLSRTLQAGPVRKHNFIEAKATLAGGGRQDTLLQGMPTYEYVCAKCGHEFEQFQSIAADPLSTCLKDACGRKKWGRGKVKRKLSTGGGLIFKGSGFYITDYRSEGYKQAAKKETAAAKPAASTDSQAATPAKPAAKAEAKPAKSKSKD